MPGVAFYGYDRKELVRKDDQLCYKYFIAPVIVIDKVADGTGDSIEVTVRNIGGMIARDIKVAALNRQDLKQLATASISQLDPDGKATVTIKTKKPISDVIAKVLPCKTYTDLSPIEPFEIYPDAQIKGMPITVCWTPEDQTDKGSPGNHINIVNLKTGKVDGRFDMKSDTGKWMEGNLYFDTNDLTAVLPGDYELRFIDGKTGKIKGRDQIKILDKAGELFVSNINGKPLAEESQEITINPGDTFEINWDLRNSSLRHPAIYISSPDDHLRIPREDGSYAVFKPGKLGKKINAPTGEPERFGSWVWKSRIELDDLLIPHGRKPSGWIWYQGRIGEDYQRVNMAANPGKWRLWIGGSSPIIPISPVITVNVTGSKPAVRIDDRAKLNVNTPKQVASKDELDITVESPKKMTTGDMVVVTVKAAVKPGSSSGSYIDKVTLFKTDRTGGDMKDIPKLRLDTVTNPEKRSRKFTANFMITSPEPGTQHYCIEINDDDNFVPFSIEVETKVIIVGQKDTIKLAMAVPNDIVDSVNFIDRFSKMHTYTAEPEFGPEKRTGVRHLIKDKKNAELWHHRGKVICGKIYNPDKMATDFEVEIPLDSIEKVGTNYYLVGCAYIGNERWYHLIRIDHVNPDRI